MILYLWSASQPSKGILPLDSSQSRALGAEILKPLLDYSVTLPVGLNQPVVGFVFSLISPDVLRHSLL